MFLVVANWKMNGNIELAESFNNGIKPLGCQIVICPPFTLISALKGNFAVGAQNCHFEQSGAFTGEVSPAMLKTAGAEYVILGHSERRQAGETSNLVAKKAIAAHEAGLKTIICVGENEGEKIENVIVKQLTESLPASANSENTVIAYEPVWAIGSGKTPKAEQIVAAHHMIGKECGFKVLYGGSVSPNNAAEIKNTDYVGGLLVGGASLNLQKFNQILEA